VLVDIANPANYEVLSQAGTFASEPRFSPDKRQLLFVDHTHAPTFSRGQITLLDLESGAVHPLFFDTEDGEQDPLQGSLRGLVWEPDGTGFYSAQSGAAGLLVAYHYDLSERSFRVFAQTQGGAIVIPYGRKGQDSILVLSTERREDSNSEHIPYFFVDAATGAYLEPIENEHLRFIPWENPERGGWKHSVYTPAYNDEKDLIAFRLNDPENRGNVAVTNLNGSFFKVYGVSEAYIDTFPRWGPAGTVLFNRSEGATSPYQTHRVMIANIETGEVSEFVNPETIDGAVGLRTPDY
jgi:hypothetical protein